MFYYRGGCMVCHAAGLYVLNANKKCAICSYGITSAFDKTPAHHSRTARLRKRAVIHMIDAIGAAQCRCTVRYKHYRARLFYRINAGKNGSLVKSIKITCWLVE